MFDFEHHDIVNQNKAIGDDKFDYCILVEWKPDMLFPIIAFEICNIFLTGQLNLEFKGKYHLNTSHDPPKFKMVFF